MNPNEHKIGLKKFWIQFEESIHNLDTDDKSVDEKYLLKSKKASKLKFNQQYLSLQSWNSQNI